MKVMLLVDLEGASLLDDWRAMSPDYPELYAVAREEITQDVNAAIRGLRKGGATEIIVADGHAARVWPDTFNIIPEKLEPGVQLVRGAVHLERATDLQALAMVGMHCRNGTPVGFMGHTTSGFTAVKFNGEWFGEVEMLAAIAGELGVRTVMVAGDDATLREAKHYMPWIASAIVKTATGRTSCDCLPGELTRPMIELAAMDGLCRAGDMPLFQVPGPVATEMFFPSAAHANMASTIPGSVPTGETSLLYTAPNFLEARRFFTTSLRLANGVGNEAMMKHIVQDPAAKARRSEYNRQSRTEFWAEPWLRVELP